HDADPATGSRRPQQGVGVCSQQPLSVGESDNPFLLRRRLPRASRQTVQGLQNRVNRGQDVRLRPAEGRKSQRGQAELQRAEVVAAEGEIMQEVSGAVMVVAMNLSETTLRHGWAGDHIRPDGREFLKNVLYVCASLPSVSIGEYHGHRYLLQII